VKPIDDAIEIAAGEPKLAEWSMPADSNASGAICAVTYDRMARHARALRLSRELRIVVVVDAAGWLKDKIEIVYHRERRRAIRPYFVRVGHLAPDADLSGEHGVWARCRRYNGALDRLHQLAAQLETMVRTGRITLVPNSVVAYAYQQLSRLDELIASQQAKTMGYSTVRLDRLADEIEFFARCDAHLAPIIERVERAGCTPPNHAPTEPQHTPARRARRWFDWFRGSHRDGAS
jgi:hypothetical protein